MSDSASYPPDWLHAARENPQAWALAAQPPSQCTGTSECDCPQHQADDEEAIAIYRLEERDGI